MVQFRETRYKTSFGAKTFLTQSLPGPNFFKTHTHLLIFASLDFLWCGLLISQKISETLFTTQEGGFLFHFVLACMWGWRSSSPVYSLKLFLVGASILTSPEKIQSKRDICSGFHWFRHQLLLFHINYINSNTKHRDLMLLTGVSSSCWSGRMCKGRHTQPCSAGWKTNIQLQKKIRDYLGIFPNMGGGSLPNSQNSKPKKKCP